jgi:hypothetical protein
MNYIIKDRAYTPEQKKDVMEILYRLWQLMPELRLGQLISNSIFDPGTFLDLFHMEDFELCRAVEKLAIRLGVMITLDIRLDEEPQQPETD